MKEKLLEDALGVIRFQHGRDLIGLLNLIELLADFSDGDGLIAHFGDGIGGQLRGARTCRDKIEEHAAREDKHNDPEKDAGKKFLRIVRAASHLLNPPSTKQTHHYRRLMAFSSNRIVGPLRVRFARAGRSRVRAKMVADTGMAVTFEESRYG